MNTVEPSLNTNKMELLTFRASALRSSSFLASAIAFSFASASLAQSFMTFRRVMWSGFGGARIPSGSCFTGHKFQSTISQMISCLQAAALTTTPRTTKDRFRVSEGSQPVVLDSIFGDSNMLSPLSTLAQVFLDDNGRWCRSMAQSVLPSPFNWC